MFDRYYCKSHFVTWKLWKSASKNYFLYYYNGAKKHETFIGFENICSRATTYFILTSLDYINFCFKATTYVILTSLDYINFYARYCWWRQILVRPRMCICKVQKPCINSQWIAWLIHGFLAVETCDTAFYAIIILPAYASKEGVESLDVLVSYPTKWTVLNKISGTLSECQTVWIQIRPGSYWS